MYIVIWTKQNKSEKREGEQRKREKKRKDFMLFWVLFVPHQHQVILLVSSYIKLEPHFSSLFNLITSIFTSFHYIQQVNIFNMGVKFFYFFLLFHFLDINLLSFSLRLFSFLWSYILTLLWCFKCFTLLPTVHKYWILFSVLALLICNLIKTLSVNSFSLICFLCGFLCS